MLPVFRQHAERGGLHARGTKLAWGVRTYVMGIVNVTPDSFSGDGRVGADDAILRAVDQAQRGSDIIDIGGESTRPGHVRIDERTEIARVGPVIRGVRERLPHAILSIDSYKPAVARAACEAGADVINSVWGLPESLLDVAVERDAPIVVMHNKREARYDGDVVDEVLRFLDEASQRALRRGLARERIMVDPGVGFGKSAKHNIAILRGLSRIVGLGFPTVLGTSRKSTIGRLTGREPHERLFGTAASTALAVEAGVDVVRVHDVTETRDVLAVADAIVRDWRPEGWIE